MEASPIPADTPTNPGKLSLRKKPMASDEAAAATPMDKYCSSCRKSKPPDQFDGRATCNICRPLKRQRTKMARQVRARKQGEAAPAVDIAQLSSSLCQLQESNNRLHAEVCRLRTLCEAHGVPHQVSAPHVGSRTDSAMCPRSLSTPKRWRLGWLQYFLTCC